MDSQLNNPYFGGVVMSNSFKKLPLFALTSSLILVAGSGFANPISDAKQCLNQAAKIASANVASAGTILADAADVRVLRSEKLALNGWSGMREDAKGIYFSSTGWSGGTSSNFYNVVYMGKDCGILSKSRLACRLQLGSQEVTRITNLDHKLKQTVGMKCSVCRGVEHVRGEMYDRFGVPAAMRASALKDDLGIAKNFSVGAVKITRFEDEDHDKCASSPGLHGGLLR